MSASPTGRSQRPLVLGHRGARQSAPENTLLAFELALEEGADGVELDVRMTQDGAIVVFHDADLEVWGGRKRRISDFPLSELRAARSGTEQIPTLDEILAWQDRSGAFLNIELKGDGPRPLELARRVADLVRGRPATLLSSFQASIVRNLSRALPDMTTALLVEREQLLGWAFWPPRLLGTSAIHPAESLLNERLLARLRAGGASWIGTWTVNSPERAVALSKLGVDAIITDTPRKILQHLA